MKYMIQDILFAFWFLLPAAIANAAPVFGSVIPVLKKWEAPIDGGHTFHGERIFGAHKTWRGLLYGIVAATLTLWLQQLAAAYTSWAPYLSGPIQYETLPTLLLGPLFAIGALGGDAVESFFKRQRGIKSGGTWIPFDQIDYIIGAIIVSLPFIILSPMQYAWMLIVWFVMHLLFSYIGWLTGLKSEPI
jgi:CDP-2,3-bis-(O-geranylgeranyl)-sn-glycerol synthase